MNKLFTSIAVASLSLTMAVGVGVAVSHGNSDAISVHAAEQSVTFDLKSSTNRTTISTTLIKYVSGDVSFSIIKGTGTNVNNYCPGGSTNNTTQTRVYNNNSVEFAVSSSYVITKVEVTATSASYFAGLNTGSNYSPTATIETSNSTATASFAVASQTNTVSANTTATGRLTTIKIYYDSPSTATLESIALSGSMTKTEYTTAESWDPTGLTVTGTYSDSTTSDLTADSTFVYYNSSDVEVAAPSDLGVGTNQTLKVVASYSGVSDTAKYVASTAINVTKAPEYELVTDPTKLTKGTTFIFVGNSTSVKAMQQSRTTSNGASGVADVTLSDNFNAGSVATTANATVFTLGGSAGAWTITNGDNQLGFTGTSNNNMQFNENQTDTFKISISNGYLLTVESNNQSGRKLQYNYNNGSPRFSNYSGNQTDIYMFANIAEATYGTTDHISITGLPETEFAVGDTFSSSGIAITAWDGADETTANPKTVSVYTTSFDGVTFSDSHIGSQTVTVTYTESGSNFTDTYSIYVYAAATYQLVESEPSGGWAGSYLITFTVSGSTSQTVADGTYAMKSSLSNFDVVGNYSAVNSTTTDGVTTIVAGQHLQWSIASYSTGYSLQGQSGKYIGWNSSSSNGLTTSDSALVNTISISSGDVTILCSAGTKGLTLNTSSGQFRYYSNATVQLYKLVESSEAAEYAATFLDLLKDGADPVCDPNGNTDLSELITAWSLLSDEFDTLSNADKQLFTQGVADETGDDIARSLSLYDWIVGRYNKTQGETDINDFMSRNPSPVGIARANIFETNPTSTTAIIVIIAVASVTTIGAIFFIKRRKYN